MKTHQNYVWMSLICGMFISNAGFGGPKRSTEINSNRSQPSVVIHAQSQEEMLQAPLLSSTIFSKSFIFSAAQEAPQPHFLDIIGNTVYLKLFNVRAKCPLLRAKINSEDWKKISIFMVSRVLSYVHKEKLMNFGENFANSLYQILSIDRARDSAKFVTDIKSLLDDMDEFFSSDYYFNNENFDALLPSHASEEKIQSNAQYLKEKYTDPALIYKIRNKVKQLLDVRKGSEQENSIKKVFQEVFGDDFLLKKLPQPKSALEEDPSTEKPINASLFLECIKHIRKIFIQKTTQEQKKISRRSPIFKRYLAQRTYCFRPPVSL